MDTSGLIQLTVPELFSKMELFNKEKATLNTSTRIYSAEIIEISSDSESEVNLEETTINATKVKLFSNNNTKHNESSPATEQKKINVLGNVRILPNAENHMKTNGSDKSENPLLKREDNLTPKLNSIPNTCTNNNFPHVIINKSNNLPNKNVNCDMSSSAKNKQIEEGNLTKKIDDIKMKKSSVHNSKKPKNVETFKSNAKNVQCTSSHTINKMPLNKLESPKKKQNPQIQKYLKLIKELFETIQRTRYIKDLITDKKVLKIFTEQNQNESFQFSCLTLYASKHKWYNIFKFCDKRNINIDQNDILKLYENLKCQRIVHTNYEKKSLYDILQNLNFAEVKAIYTELKCNKALSTKEDMIKLICQASDSIKSRDSIIWGEIKNKMGLSIKAKQDFIDSFFNIYLLGTFTNPNFLNINEYFNNYDKKIAFPEYAVEDYPVFDSRNEFLNYSKAMRYYCDIKNNRNHVPILDIANKIFKELKRNPSDKASKKKYEQAPHLQQFSQKSVYINALTLASESLVKKFPKKVKKWLEYLIDNYKSHKIGKWYYLLALSYLKLTHNDTSANLVIIALKNKKQHISDIQNYNLRELGQKLILSKKKNKISQLQHDTLVKLVQDLINIDEFPIIAIDALLEKRSSRSNIVLKYFKELNYTEGGFGKNLIVSTFTLCFWDIIYNPQQEVSAAFLSKIQQVPLDMITVHFYQNRKQEIDQRLKEIKYKWTDDQLIRHVNNNYRLHSHESGLCNIAEDIPDYKILEVLIVCVGRKTLANIYQRLVKDFTTYSIGLPDILVCNIENHSCKFIMLKNKFMTEQKLWFHFLRTIGAQIEICTILHSNIKRKHEGEIKSPTSKKFKKI